MEDRDREDGFDEVQTPLDAERLRDGRARRGRARGCPKRRRCPAGTWSHLPGYENKVRQNPSTVESMGAGDLIFEVVVPTEEVVELHQGQRRTVQRRIFPGYVLVNMILDEHSWTVVRNTPGVTGFVGSGKEPTPLLEDEVAKIMQRMEAGAPRVRVSFQPGSKVRITDGPFAEFIGTVDTIDNDRRKVRVMVNFFGRDTPIELDFLQVEEI